MFTDYNRGVSFIRRSGNLKWGEWQINFEGDIQATAYCPAPPSPYSRARVIQVHPRVYGVLDTLAPAEMAKEPHRGYAIPLSNRTEAEEQMAKEWSAWKRATIKVGKAELIRLLEAALDEDIWPGQVTFSVNAGCSACPCSPGFIVKNVEGLKGLSSVHFEKVSQS
jgi:hypothetical protein